MVEELEERERAFKKTRLDKKNEEIKVQVETERIKEEGRKLRERKEEDIRKRNEERIKGQWVEEDDVEAPELRMFSTSYFNHLRLSILIRPTRYDNSTKIFIKETSRINDTRVNSQTAIRFRRSRYGIDRSFPQGSEEECGQTSQKRDGSRTLQAN